MLASPDPKLEFINLHGNTSLFALDVLRKHGRLDEMKLLSLACLMPHLADYLGIFHTVYHNTMVQTRLPVAPEKFPARFVEYMQDFFSLPALDVDCVISQTVIHCFNDSRYGNSAASDRWQKPYEAAARLRQIVGAKQIPVIVSIAVNRDEAFIDNNVHLSHEKFVRSFETAGFKLQDHFFDYLCGGLPQRPEYMEVSYRRSKELPTGTAAKEWVVGNYYFQ
jgi:hypothetical protein